MRAVASAGRALAVAVLVVAAGACGGGGSHLSKDGYRREAAAICRDAGASVAKVRADASTSGAVASSIEQVVAIERSAAAKVHALALPRGDEVLLRRWLDLVDESVAQLDAAARAAGAGDAAVANAANARARALDAQADTIARQYGITACVAGS